LFFNNLDGSYIESGVSRLSPFSARSYHFIAGFNLGPFGAPKRSNATTCSVYQMAAAFGVHLPRHCDKFLHRNSRARRHRQQAGRLRGEGVPWRPALKQTSRIDRCSYVGRCRRENIPDQEVI